MKLSTEQIALMYGILDSIQDSVTGNDDFCTDDSLMFSFENKAEFDKLETLKKKLLTEYSRREKRLKENE